VDLKCGMSVSVLHTQSSSLTLLTLRVVRETSPSRWPIGAANAHPPRPSPSSIPRSSVGDWGLGAVPDKRLVPGCFTRPISCRSFALGIGLCGERAGEHPPERVAASMTAPMYGAYSRCPSRLCTSVPCLSPASCQSSQTLLLLGYGILKAFSRVVLVSSGQPEQVSFIFIPVPAGSPSVPHCWCALA
jgi:hypothetical protein